LRDKNFWALRHNATSMLPFEPQADEKALSKMASIRPGKFTWSCSLTETKKPDLFRSGFLPLSLFGDKPYVTRSKTQLHFPQYKFSAPRKANNC
jgi:hypothetical protein